MSTPTRSGLFATTTTLPPTVIFHLGTRFKADVFPKKLNLGIGVYRNEALQSVVFTSVRKAEKEIEEKKVDMDYLPQAGLPEFRIAAARLLFGENSSAILDKRIQTVQSLSGTGALTLASHLIKRILPGRRFFCSDPTWENHGKVVADSGLGMLEYYRYYDSKTCGLDEHGLLADLEAMPEGSIVLLHAVAHNPTGVDPSRAQWALIADIMKRRSLFPWFDIAYQGFASGDPDEDAWAVREFVSRGFEMIACQSFAKNLGLYSERIGALHIVASDPTSANAVLTQLEHIIRPMYSNPPAHGARVVAQVLQNPTLAAEWRAELLSCMQRVQRMRKLLFAAITERGTPGDWSHVVNQIGMFSYTGLNEKQCERMIEEFHIYMLLSGRINIAGLNEATIGILADAIHAVITT